MAPTGFEKSTTADAHDACHDGGAGGDGSHLMPMMSAMVWQDMKARGAS